ncbi:MAG: TIGR00296 family protein [Thermoplasmata archaeon]|nr:TIGR00296 family protein [Candidatus Sysuiplasma acidicola]MBX8646812.1 TIGR00296 family protein [Candidatus Sysuiplasma acidicola]
MLSDEEGRMAVRYAREVVDSTVSTGSYRSPHMKLTQAFSAKTGAFVTLTTHPEGRLRGCIGYSDPVFELKLALLNAAAEAAVGDPRFEPVTASELPQLIVEVSVLTTPEHLAVKTPWELPGKINVGRDGLIVERGRFRGLLLPQVAVEEGWSSEEFLCQTCWKAELPENSWKEANTKVFRFEAEVFHELEPHGDIERKHL